MPEYTPPEVARYQSGTIVANRFRIVQTLGWGAMGLVLKVEDLNLNNEVMALKILYAECASDAATLARFRREVVLSRKLSHPNIVRVYDFGQTERVSPQPKGTSTYDYFISMEYVEGKTLKQMIKEGTLSVEQVVALLMQITRGLERAHREGILHRDLKPENVLISADGTAKITDFGTARPMISDEKLTKTDETVGTPIYISPEMIQTGKGDNRTDLYALGVIAFEIAEGKPPYYSDNWVVLANKHLSAPIPRLSNTSLPGWYQEVVDNLMAKEIEDRYSDAGEVLRVLGDIDFSKAENQSAESSGEFELSVGTIVKSLIALVGCVGSYLIGKYL